MSVGICLWFAVSFWLTDSLRAQEWHPTNRDRVYLRYVYYHHYYNYYYHYCYSFGIKNNQVLTHNFVIPIFRRRKFSKPILQGAGRLSPKPAQVPAPGQRDSVERNADRRQGCLSRDVQPDANHSAHRDELWRAPGAVAVVDHERAAIHSQLIRQG